MSKLSDLQRDIQLDVLGMAAGADRHVAVPCEGTRRQRLDVYRKAYLLRLTEFLANDYERLKRYLGETRFNDMASAYALRHPSDNPNARWFSRHLPDFLKDSPAYRRYPEVTELARLEQALNDVFDGPESPIVTMPDLAAIAPQDFGGTVFELSPSMRKFEVMTNVASLWSSLRCDETPPPAEVLPAPSQILVWRQNLGARFRILGAEEAMALDCVAQGLNFATICEMMATFDDAEGAAMRAAGYLRGWLEAEVISRVRCNGMDRK